VGARLLPLSLLAGVAAGVATAAVYQRGWSLALAVATVLVVLVVTPPGWGTRLPYALGYTVLVGYLSVPRGEGDYAISSSGPGYAVLGLGIVVLAFAVGTLPRPGRRGSDTGGSGGSAGVE
jgi:hypothetical protein